MKWLTRTPVINLAVAALILSTAFGSVMPALATNDVWELHNPANRSNSDNYLNGVTAISSSNVWAVGAYIDFNGALPLIEHSTGSAWSISTTPTVNYDSELYGVSGINASNVWAVGYQGSSTRGGEQPWDAQPTVSGNTLVEKYNGTSWGLQTSPSPGTGYNTLRSVYANSTSDIWAVGFYYDAPTGPYRTLILHTTNGGTTWSQVTSPNPGTNNSLYGVTCVSSSECWAVGNADSNILIVHYSNSTWSTFTSSGSGYLNKVACFSCTDCRAVGETGIPAHTLSLKWNGSNWSTETTPNPASNANNNLASVAYVGADDWIWAVGSYDNNPWRTLIAVFHTSWAQVTSANQGTGDNHLNGVAVVPGTTACTGGDSWAVGWYHNTTSGLDLTMAQSYRITPQCR